MTPTKLLPAIAFFSLVTVEVGGWSLLGLIGTDTLSPFQERSFRAGHAHAGTLLVLALVSFVFLGRTGLDRHADHASRRDRAGRLPDQAGRRRAARQRQDAASSTSTTSPASSSRIFPATSSSTPSPAGPDA